MRGAKHTVNELSQKEMNQGNYNNRGGEYTSGRELGIELGDWGQLLVFVFAMAGSVPVQLSNTKKDRKLLFE